jgi:Leucine-rich repeat (LRR) protein
MIKLNIFLLLNFFLIINSENCRISIPCNCSTQVIDEAAKNKQLYIFDCKSALEKLPEIQNIKSIFLDSRNIISFPDNLISNENCFYKNVTLLSITNTNLSSINNSDFKCLSKLQQLQIGHNEITTINADAFKNSGEMIQLVLSGNKITSVDQNSFCRLSKLLLIDLKINLITSLPENICFPTKITFLYLSYNQIISKFY